VGHVKQLARLLPLRAGHSFSQEVRGNMVVIDFETAAGDAFADFSNQLAVQGTVSIYLSLCLNLVLSRQGGFTQTDFGCG